MKSTIQNSGIKRQVQLGLSLVELMISITIGLLILVSLSSMFINQSKARAELDKSNRMIDNGRYSLEVLSSNLRLAGFFDTYAPAGIATAQYDPCDPAMMVDPAPPAPASVSALDLLRVPVEGYNAPTPTSEVSPLPPLCGLSYTTGTPETLKSGSDLLVIRSASTTTIPRALAVNNGTVYLQVSSCQFDTTKYRISTNRDDLILGQKNNPGINNCVSASGVTTITPPYNYVRALKTVVYFISPENNVGDGIPTLKRRELTAVNGLPSFVTTPLVEGIEYMQVEYGIDTIGPDGAADIYKACAPCTLDEWSNVVSVTLYLVSRNIEQTRGYIDNKRYSLGSAGTVGPLLDPYKRHAYTQQIRLVNPSSRREIP